MYHRYRIGEQVRSEFGGKGTVSQLAASDGRPFYFVRFAVNPGKPHLCEESELETNDLITRSVPSEGQGR